MVHVDIFLRPLISLSKSLLTICCCHLTYFSLPSHNGPVHHNHIQPINNTSSTWTNHKENQKVISRILLSFNVLCSSVSQQYIALCVLCSVGSSVLKNWNPKITFPWTKIIFEDFFLCSFRMKTLKTVSVFIFRHWKHYFRNTQNREK